MLALDSTIGCIEASEPDVLDMYRSAPVMTTQVAGSMTESCEAYVCAIRKKSRVHVYVALVADDKRIFVYRPSGDPDTEDEYHHTLQEALNFAGSLGFSPERMNLNYSPAMREVVVRNIKILRPPGSKVQAVLRHGMADAPTSSGLKKSPAQKKPVSPVAPAAASSAQVTVSPAAASPTRPPLALSAAPQEELAMATPAHQAATAGSVHPSGAAELAELREVISRLTDDNQLLNKRAGEEVALLRRKLASALSDGQKASEQLASVRAERLESQHAREKDGAKSLSDLKEQMERELTALSLQRDEANRLRNELVAQHAKQTEALSGAREEIAALIVERDAARQSAEQSCAATAATVELRGKVAELAALREADLLQIGKLEEENSAQADEARKLRGEIATLTAQREAALLQVGKLEEENSARSNEARVLRYEVSELAAQREMDRLQIGRLVEENSAQADEARVLRGEIAELTAHTEAKSLPDEKVEPDAATLAAEAASQSADLAMLCLDAEMLQQQEAGFQFVKEIKDAPHTGTGVPPEAASLPAGQIELASPSAPPQQEAEAKRPDPEHFPTAARESGAETDWYAAPAPKPAKQPESSDADCYFFPVEEPQGGPGRFLLQPSISAIECGSPADVVELHHSINHAYLSPEGKETESCQGYICCLRTAGAALRVNVALLGTRSGRTWVYLPEVQPADRQSYANAVAAAIEFAEGVGFVMERVRLAPEHRHHDEAVMRCKVLRCTEGI